MKVTVTPDGEVSFDTDDIVQAVNMIKALRNGATSPMRKKRGPYKKRSSGPVEEIVPVSPSLVETWQWLVDNDKPTGAAIQEIADGLGIKNPAVTFRLNKLIQKGLAHKVRRGYYRPGESG